MKDPEGGESTPPRSSRIKRKYIARGSFGRKNPRGDHINVGRKGTPQQGTARGDIIRGKNRERAAASAGFSTDAPHWEGLSGGFPFLQLSSKVGKEIAQGRRGPHQRVGTGGAAPGE